MGYVYTSVDGYDRQSLECVIVYVYAYLGVENIELYIHLS